MVNKKTVFPVLSISSVRVLVSRASVAFVLLLSVILFSPVVKYLCLPLIVDEEPRLADAIIILSANDGFDTAEGFPDLATLSRIYKGLELYKAGYAPKIICVGGKILPVSGKSLAQVMRDNLVLSGVDERQVFVQDEIEGDWNYYKNLLMLSERFRGSIVIDKSIIVTSPHNSYRIKKIFARQGLHPIVVSASMYMISPVNWHENFGLFRELANEYWAIVLFWCLDRI